MRSKHRSILGITLGLSVGLGFYGGLRILLPPSFAMGSVVIGLCAGIGARLCRAFGTPNQMRVIIFGSLFGVILIEKWLLLARGSISAYEQVAMPENLLEYFASNPVWLAFTLLFLIAGIVMGLRVLVGNDPMADIREHGVTMSPSTEREGQDSTKSDPSSARD